MIINDQHKVSAWDPTKQNKIWVNCTQADKNDLDKIQNDAARIATGATKLVSINKLYKEICWESLQKRHNDHKLTLFFKMYNHLSPQYLPPPPLNTPARMIYLISRYNLRNSDTIRTIRAKRINTIIHVYPPH